MFLTSTSALGLILGLMISLWLVSLGLRNASIVDIFWGTGFVITAWFYQQNSSGFEPRSLLVAVLVTVWGLRLSLHILARNAGKGEDFRYAAWRAQYGRTWWLRSLFQVFLLQGVILWFVSLPLPAAMALEPAGWTVFDGLGVLLWLTGFAFEAGGDWQLARFKARPESKGKLLTTGFWGLTRHPNYFGDAMVWWGLFCLALPGGWWLVLSPLLMNFLLLRVSGVAMLERTMNQKPGYESYMKNTPAFFPRIFRTSSKSQ